MKSVILGWVILIVLSVVTSSEALTKYPFEGVIDLATNKVNLSVNLAEKGSLQLQAQKIDRDHINAWIKIDHFKARFLDVSSEVEGTIDFSAYSRDKAQPIRGRIWSQYTIINYQPISELKGNFEIKDHRLTIGSLSYGHIAVNGFADVTAPYHFDFLVTLKDLEMTDFIDFWMTDRKFDTSGQVSGTIRASGESNKIFLKGQLETFHGVIKKLAYESFHLNAEGYFPNLHISESKITQEDGLSYTIDGPIDLADKENFKKQVVALNVMPIVSDSGNKLEWTIRSSKDEKSGGSTQIKYLLRKNDTLGSPTDKDKEMLSVQKSLEF